MLVETAGQGRELSVVAGSLKNKEKTPELDTASAVLAFARERRAAAQAAEADVMVAALAWAEQHPVESILGAAGFPGGECAVAVAGPGAPLVAEFAIAEFAAAIGVSTDAGRA